MAVSTGGKAGIDTDDGTIKLSYTDANKPGVTVYANRYEGKVKLDNSCQYMDGSDEKVLSARELTASEKAAIAGKTLRPVDLFAVIVSDAIEHGMVVPMPYAASKYKFVDLFLDPDEGYVYKAGSLKVTDPNNVDVSLEGDGTDLTPIISRCPTAT